MKTLHYFQQRTTNFISEERLELLFKILKKFIPFEADLYNEVILLESRYYTNQHRLLTEQIISKEAANVESNTIKKALIYLIKDLSAEDLHLDLDKTEPILNAIEEEHSKKKNKNDQGAIMHRIPDKMEVHKSIKCFVRIAFEESQLYNNLILDENIKVEHRTIGDIIDVSLVEPTSEKFFEVTSITDAEQFVNHNDYTEWIFYVTPKKEGTFPLFLKVAVIEKIDGKDRPKNIIIDKEINIVSYEVKEVASLKKVKELDYAFSLVDNRIQETKTKGIAPPPTKRRSLIRGLTFLGMSLPALIVTAGIGGALGFGGWTMYQNYQEDLAFNSALQLVENDLCGDQSELEDFLIEYPKSRHKEKVEEQLSQLYWEEAKKGNDCKSYQTYLTNCPDGFYVLEAKNKIRYLCQKDPEKAYSPKVLSLSLQKNEDQLEVNVAGGNAPYEWNIKKKNKQLIEDTLLSVGKHLIDLEDCCQKPGKYLFTIRDGNKKSISTSFKQDAITVFNNTSPVIGIERSGENLVVNIIGGKAPFKIDIGQKGKPVDISAALESGGKQSIGLKKILDKEGLYKVLLTDAANQKAGATFPMDWTCNVDDSQSLTYLSGCENELIDLAKRWNKPYFIYQYDPTSKESKKMDCTLSDQKIIAYAEKHFLYQEDNIKQTKTCSNLTPKGIVETPSIQFFLANGEKEGEIKQYVDKEKMMNMMRSIVNKNSRETDAINLNPSKRIDNSDDEYFRLLSTEEGVFRWVERLSSQNPVIQIAVVQDEKRVMDAARCLQKAEPNKKIYIYNKDRTKNLGFKILMSGFASESDARVYCEKFTAKNFCEDHFSTKSQPFLKRY